MSELYSQDSEYLVLGAMILDREAGASALDAGLDREHFYLAETKAYFDVIKELYIKNGMCDSSLVKNALKTKIDAVSGKSLFEVFGGEVKLTELALSYTNHDIELVDKNVDILFEKYNFRNIKKVGLSLFESDSYDEQKVSNIISTLVQSFKTRSEARVTSLSEIASNYLTQLEDKLLHFDKYESLHTGFSILDECSVIQPGTTTYLAARTSAGKSAFLLQALDNIVENGKNVLLFSSEIDRQEILNRIMSRISNVGVDSLRDPNKNEIPEVQYPILKQAHAKVVKNKNSFMVYDWSTDVDQLLRIADSVRIRTKLDCIALDYIQNLQFSSSDNRRLEITEAGKKLFNYGKKHNIAMIVVSQLRRSKEVMPTIYDLKESGDLENSSDKIILLYRKEVNSLKTDECMYSVAKNRTGRTSEWVVVTFDGEHQTFIENGRPTATQTLVPQVGYDNTVDLTAEEDIEVIEEEIDIGNWSSEDVFD